MNVKEVNKRNQYGETAVHRAAKAGNLDRLTACLATPGVNINCRDNNGYTALHEAVLKVIYNHISTELKCVSILKLFLLYNPPFRLLSVITIVPAGPVGGGAAASSVHP